MGMTDPLGDRMKALERAFAGTPIPPSAAIYARIDGRGFSRFTRDMIRPFDPRMTRAMLSMAGHLLEETHATAVYVQSDEVSLLWAPAIRHDLETGEIRAGEHFFAGQPMKIVSVLAGLATAAFTRAVCADTDGLADWAARLPHFDARVVGMPDIDDAVAAIAWRGGDARRNGIRQLASAHFSPQQLHGKSTRAAIDMLSAKEVHLRDQPAASLNGTLLRRILVERVLTPAERAAIPEAHRPPPEMRVKRHQTVAYSAMHPGRMTNLRAVLLDGAEPRREDVAARHA